MRDPWATDVEAYVLGALDEAERAAFETHLRTCAPCRAAVDEVGRLPALLDLVPPDVVASLSAQDPAVVEVPERPVELVPASVLAGLLRSARAESRRRARRLAAALAAVAAALLLLVPASPLALGQRDRGTAPEVLTMVADGPSPVTASIVLRPVAWGTSIELSCRYEPSAPDAYGASGTAYALRVVDRDGSSQQVATWSAVPGRTLTVPAVTDRPIGRIASVELVDAAGTVLLTAAVGPSPGPDGPAQRSG